MKQETVTEVIVRAQEAYRAGDDDRAEALCKEVLAGDDQCFEALLLLAIVEFRRDRLETADRLASAALAAGRRSAEGCAVHAMILKGLGQNEAALARYDQALEIEPQLPNAHYNRGNVLHALGRHEQALVSYDAALAQVAGDFQALANRGIVLFDLGRYQEALDSYARALGLRPDHAEVLNNRGNALLALDYGQEALDSYEKALASRPRYPEALSNRGNALQAVGRTDDALRSYAQALSQAPDYPEAHNNRAVALLALGRQAEALAAAERAISLQPRYAEAHNTRGNALAAMEQFEEALGACTSAYALRPNGSRALGVGNALNALGRYEEALEWYDKALEMEPSYVEALNNRGNVLQALHRHDEALTCYAQAISLKPSEAEAHWNEGLARLALGDYERGWEKYEWRWYNRKLNSPRPYSDTPAWSGTQPLAGKTILLYPEQGFGDAIQFVRYVPRVKALGARVMIVCHPKLAAVFRTVAGADSVLMPGEPVPHFDYHAALMSLPLAFRTRLDDLPAHVPYLAADAAATQAWAARFLRDGTRPRVGLVWSGNPVFPGARAKACPLEQFTPLFDRSDCMFYSLQTGEAAHDLAKLESPRENVIDVSPDLHAFSDTAAALSGLDVVISIDTAVAHLAGALAKPVWVLLPYVADWRWLIGRKESPWYPSARLFRQHRRGDWQGAIGDLGEALAEFAQRRDDQARCTK